jgi:hypothetical protein
MKMSISAIQKNEFSVCVVTPKNWRKVDVIGVELSGKEVTEIK